MYNNNNSNNSKYISNIVNSLHVLWIFVSIFKLCIKSIIKLYVSNLKFINALQYINDNGFIINKYLKYQTL